MMKVNLIKNKKKKYIKALVFMLELLAIGIISYLIILPFWPRLQYKLIYQGKQPNVDWQNLEQVKEKVGAETFNFAKNEFNNNEARLPAAEYEVSPNRVIIPKIGVNAPIVIAQNGDWAMNQGAWLLPDTSTPNKGGNTVITGHRFKYLPPSNLTFYLFHELEVGDIVSLIWDKDEYYYEIREIKIIEPTDFSILEPTDKPILTLFTCEPIYSQDKRLVVISRLVERKNN